MSSVLKVILTPLWTLSGVGFLVVIVGFIFSILGFGTVGGYLHWFGFSLAVVGFLIGVIKVFGR
jgi:hypothetical protein